MGWHRRPGVGTIWEITVLLLLLVSSAYGKRHLVYWNSTNTRLAQDDFSIDVNSGDYLDILCPHYPPGTPESSPPETLVLYLVREEQFRGCVETEGAIKRWECNHPHAPLGPVRFTEKIQRFTPFSMGFEFLSGHHYYYSSLTSKAGPLLPCMKLKVTVCCNTRTPGQHIKGSAARTRLSLLIILIPLFLHSSV